MNLAHLLQAIPEAVKTVSDLEITDICYDSRRVIPGAVYVCLPGTRTDGHQFIGQALAKGARAIVCQRTWLAQNPPETAEIVWVGVHDTRVALAELAAAFYGHPARALNLIGVTGTNGKTTVTHLIRSLLEASGQPTGLIGTLGCFFQGQQMPTGFTTPFAPELQQILAQMQQAGARAVTMECSSHALDQHRLDALEFNCAVFTNLTQDHLDYHQTMTAYARAKQILFQRLLKSTGTALINRDDPLADEFMACSRGAVLTYGFDARADLRALEPVFSATGASFQLLWQGQRLPIQIALPGHYNILNALAAFGVGLLQGLSASMLADGFSRLAGVPGRMEVVSSPEAAFSVIVDYAHTPDSLENVLKTARQFTKGRLICVFGCGGDRDRGKRPLMGAVAAARADHVVLTSDNPRSEDPQAILTDIRSGMSACASMEVEPDRALAIERALAQASAGDVVLIAGKGHETDQIFADRTISFDDRQIARQWLERNS
jgi:UDP-N-acetylmuramoyl-L-alanyl-D-glutamate--2,6-diaminopimelate ligase